MNIRELLNKWLARKGSKIERSMPVIYRKNVGFRADFDFILQHEIYRNRGKLKFIQIGANDGVSRKDDIFEYIQHYDVEGIMLEPQHVVYKKLEKNLANYPKIKTLNKAIHAIKKNMVLYYIDQESLSGMSELPLWAKTSGVASFDKQHVLEHAKKINIKEEKISAYEVDCMTLDELFISNNYSHIDLLKIDVEGYDYEVLKMLNFDKLVPTIIRFEHSHMPKIEYEEIIDKLIQRGYLFIADKMNTTAYLKAQSLV